MSDSKRDGGPGRIRGALDSTGRVLDTGFNRTRASKVEKHHEFSVMWISFGVIVLSSALFFLIGWLFFEGEWSTRDFFYNMGCNILAMFVVVLCLDTLVNRNRDSRHQREESRRILRYHRLIAPEIDMYLVRKNMVVTPNGRPVHKFRINSDFSVQDMRDMYSPSDLVSDVGISKIKRYGHYQGVLADHFKNIIESVDFTYYPEIADAVMRYLNATSYGEAALDAVMRYEDAKSGTRLMRVIVSNMIREEPEDGTFMGADPVMKNVYLVHQMINEQEAAVAEYLRMVNVLKEQDPGRYNEREEVEYERCGGPGRRSRSSPPSPCTPGTRRGRRPPPPRPANGRTPGPSPRSARTPSCPPSVPRRRPPPRSPPRRIRRGRGGAWRPWRSGRPETCTPRPSPASPP